MRRLVICLALAMLGSAALCRAEGAATMDIATATPLNADTADTDTRHDAVRQRLDAVLSDPSFQTDLPGVTAGSGEGDTSRTRGRQRRGREPFTGAPPDRQRPRFEMRIPKAGTIAKIALGVFLVAMFVTMMGSFTVEARRHWRHQVKIADSEPEPLPRTNRRENDESPEVLASSGRYGEAAHLVLGQVLGRLSERLTLAPGLRHSLTSREILARPELASRREALAVLVETVERSWFGGSTVDREAYERCLDARKRLSIQPAAAATAEPR